MTGAGLRLFHGGKISQNPLLRRSDEELRGAEGPVRTRWDGLCELQPRTQNLTLAPSCIMRVPPSVLVMVPAVQFATSRPALGPLRHGVVPTPTSLFGLAQLM